MKYIVKAEPEALTDIQDITNWYNLQQSGLGERFQKIVIGQIDHLEKNPHIYDICYFQIRCMMIRRFPYMVHFFINEETKTVEVLAVIGTSRDPRIWLRKTRKDI